MFHKKKLVSFLDEDWNLLFSIKFEYYPKKDDFVYINSVDKYFKILHVIHYLASVNGPYQGYHVVVEEAQIKK